MTTRRKVLAQASTRPAFDKDILLRAHATLITTVGDISRHALHDPETGERWEIEIAQRANAAACRDLRINHLLASRLDPAWVTVPEALVVTESGPVLAFATTNARRMSCWLSGDASLAEFLDISIGAASALSHAHSRNILHRNISPDRLVRHEDGTIRLEAFGCGIALDEHGDWHELPVSDLSLPYSAPEAALRSDPTADRTSDLYSLGVTLFELLTGRLPFNGQTPAEWLHAHLAMQPPRPSSFREVPPIVDDIILKLLTKDPAGRYQTASGLEADLIRCKSEWKTQGTIEPFPLDRGASSALLWPKRLFGRSRETRILNAAHGRVKVSGEFEIVLISGAPGAGKSALAAALTDGLNGSEAILVSGKSDRHERNIPYGPVAQALRALIRQLLAAGDVEIALARERLLGCLAGQGQLVADLVPELAHVLGRSSATVDMPAELAQGRVNVAILNTFRAFGRPGRPVVLFLDDLQWADDSTAGLLRTFAAAKPVGILLLGAYRSADLATNDVVPRMAATARSHGTRVTSIKLRPLTPSEVISLVATAIGQEASIVRLLALDVHRKTEGNPFFVGQLLRTLVEERLLRFDCRKGGWSWDQTEIERHCSADNVVDLLVWRLDRLSAGAREILRTLACIGPRSDANILARVLQISQEQLRQQAQTLKDAGLLLGSEIQYEFSHDRVHDAAYALSDDRERPMLHRRIATLMIEGWREGWRDVTFEVANQIERADSTFLESELARSFASTLIAVSRKAKSAAAIEMAARHLESAWDILGADAWRAHYDLSFQCSVLSSECSIILADFNKADREIDDLLAHAASATDRAAGYRLRASLQTLRSDYEGAIEAALSGLSGLGVELARYPSNEEAEEAYRSIQRALEGKGIDVFVEVPTVSAPEVEAAMELLSTCVAAFFVDDGLSFTHLAKLVELTLRHGATPASVYGLAWYGVFIAHHYSAYEDGYAFSEAALALLDRHGWEASRPAALVAMDQVSVWIRPISFALARAREGAAAGHTGGDLGMACYAWNHIVSDRLVMGDDLDSVVEEATKGLALATSIGFRDIERLITAQITFARELTGKVVTESSSALVVPVSGDPTAGSVSRATVFWELLYSGMGHFYRREFALATRDLAGAGKLKWVVPAHIDLASYHLFFGLSLARNNEVTPADRIAEITKHRDQLSAWEVRNPALFSNKVILIEAEIARLKEHSLLALQAYERSANVAATAGLVHEHALAHELASVLARELGLESAARNHARIACENYRRWGAIGKARSIEGHGPAGALVVSDEFSSAAGQHALDIAVWIDAARTFSEEIVLDRLIEKLMTSMIVHAGAQRGMLFLIHDGKPVIEASGQVVEQKIEVEIGARIPTSQTAPMDILEQVLHTRKSVIVNDANASSLEVDPEKAAAPKRSAIGLPLLKQGHLVGVLYLENNLAAGVFTTRRTAMIELLAPQAAISLEAARFYGDLVNENIRRRESEKELRSARAELARTSHLTVMGGLAASIAHEINQPLAGISTNAAAGMRWLRRSEPDLGQAAANLSYIQRNATRAADIVHAIRSLARQVPASLTDVYLDDIIAEVLTLISAEIETSHVMLEARLGVGCVATLGDRIQLQQVVLNLVTNAIEAMKTIDRSRRRLLVTTKVSDRWFVAGVHDSGGGVDPRTAQRMFDPFFTTKTTGMGMGLAICRSIMEAHGGTLSLEDSQLGGSALVFRIPVIAAK